MRKGVQIRASRFRRSESSKEAEVSRYATVRRHSAERTIFCSLDYDEQQVEAPAPEPFPWQANDLCRRPKNLLAIQTTAQPLINARDRSRLSEGSANKSMRKLCLKFVEFAGVLKDAPQSGNEVVGDRWKPKDGDNVGFERGEKAEVESFIGVLGVEGKRLGG